ncbi:MAG: guanylate kinase [Candidatus Cloacimonetes bacterium]|nr:guanylate kinase [Candidatus Cloacimonadota bacterium]MCB5287067.1 guanylate kinase [Candidatus Cloacimonadota bacterium]MCK9184534.1 guanylate kinase [Candidatus Cloacimonadota bacterium]MCK9584214.1 guanylate kinase [Candidatus Cloacimonadota bacterium]MDY0229387.1 guanylate kinase [Candidatus Cloacimonadaceae bacterium]
MIEKSSSFLIILSAPSGGGKSTILNEILKKADNIDYSVSYTTRAPRGTEQNGVHYHFIDEADFETRIAQGDFLEHAKVFGHSWYGTSISYIQSRLKLGHHVIMDIDVQGTAQISATAVPYVKIFIIPPSMEVLKERLIKRGTDSAEAIQRRLDTAEKELDSIPDYDYLVINDDLDQAADYVMAIIKAEENRVCRYHSPRQEFLQQEKKT